jgi:hypothetical protein
MRRLALLPVPLAAALLVTASAPAQTSSPGTFAISERGSLQVASSVLVTRRGADMRGGWTNDRISCQASHRLTVRIEIFRTANGQPAGEVRRRKTGPVTNCAEGGPNFGFDLAPKDYAMACANGRWRPGRYSMTTTTLDVRSGISAHASLYHQVTRRC